MCKSQRGWLASEVPHGAGGAYHVIAQHDGVEQAGLKQPDLIAEPTLFHRTALPTTVTNTRGCAIQRSVRAPRRPDREAEGVRGGRDVAHLGGARGVGSWSNPR